MSRQSISRQNERVLSVAEDSTNIPFTMDAFS